MKHKKQKVGNVPILRFPGFKGEWVESNLGGTSKMQAGKFVSASEISDEYESDLYPCYGGNGIRGYTKAYNYIGKYSLIGRQGALCGNVSLAEGKFYATEHALVVTPVVNIDTVWYYYLLNRLNLNQYATGMAQPGLSVKNLEEIRCSYPNTIDEQIKIGKILTLITEKIQTQSKLIKSLKTQMSELQIKIFKQQLKFKDSTKGQFSNWKFCPGGEIFENISNKTKGKNKPILAITQDKGAIPRELIDYQISVTEKSIDNYKEVEIGDFIISLRSFQGGIEHSEYEGICSPAYVVLRNKKEVNRLFYKYFFKTNFYIQSLNKKLEGIRDGKMISYKYFSEIMIPFPSLEEQNKIADILNALEEKINLEKAILSQLEKQKKYLLQNLFV